MESKIKNIKTEDSELGKGSLFATGLVAGGALAGVIVALLTVDEGIAASIANFSAEHGLTALLGAGGYNLLGVVIFGFMAWVLYKIAIKPEKNNHIPSVNGSYYVLDI